MLLEIMNELNASNRLRGQEDRSRELKEVKKMSYFLDVFIAIATKEIKAMGQTPKNKTNNKTGFVMNSKSLNAPQLSQLIVSTLHLTGEPSNLLFISLQAISRFSWIEVHAFQTIKIEHINTIAIQIIKNVFMVSSFILQV